MDAVSDEVGLTQLTWLLKITKQNSATTLLKAACTIVINQIMGRLAFGCDYYGDAPATSWPTPVFDGFYQRASNSRGACFGKHIQVFKFGGMAELNALGRCHCSDTHCLIVDPGQKYSAFVIGQHFPKLRADLVRRRLKTFLSKKTF